MPILHYLDDSKVHSNLGHGQRTFSVWPVLMSRTGPSCWSFGPIFSDGWTASHLGHKMVPHQQIGALAKWRYLAVKSVKMMPTLRSP